MQESEQLILLYVGSLIDVMAIEEMLLESDIPAFIRNDFASAVLAGWVPPDTGSNVSIFIAQKYFIQAKYLLDNYLSAIGDTQF